jgi:hypothetical protein
MRRLTALIVLPLIAVFTGCAKAPTADPMANGLLLSLAVLESGPSGPVPQPAQLGIVTHDGNAWSYRFLEDEDSNVFHKAMVFAPAGGETAILTAGGTKATVKLWDTTGSSQTLWEKDFGGKFSRMRDLEVADVNGDGITDIVVATHDQGVVAVLYGDAGGTFTATELDAEPNTFVHEVEVGDLDGDGVLEIYATPSLPNKLDGTPQPGFVTRYVPGLEEGRVVVADLGDRHAKEILVDDVDGDGIDELYVSVEAVAGGRVEIVRFDADTDPSEGMLITSLDDNLCRFLTVGDIDGDGTSGRSNRSTATRAASSTRRSSPTSTVTASTNSTSPTTMTARSTAMCGSTASRSASCSTHTPRGCRALRGTSCPHRLPSSLGRKLGSRSDTKSPFWAPGFHTPG